MFVRPLKALRTKQLCFALASRGCRGLLCSLALTVLAFPCRAQAQESRSASSGLIQFRTAVAGDRAGASVPTKAASFLPAAVEPAARSTSWSNYAEEAVAWLLRLGEVESYKENPAAGFSFSHTTTAVKIKLPVMDQSRLNFVADVGVGTTRLRSVEFGTLPVQGNYRVSEYFFSLLGGLTLQYAVTDDFRAFVGARRNVYVNDTEEFLVNGNTEPGHLLDASSWNFPLTVGLEFKFR